MFTATSTRASSSPSKPPPSSAAATPASQHPAVEDIELDDGLDDHELSDSERQLDQHKNMGYRNEDSGGAGGVKKMGEVANAISSCAALSFFSISMILANKVCERVCASECARVRACVCSWKKRGRDADRWMQRTGAEASEYA